MFVEQTPDRFERSSDTPEPAHSRLADHVLPEVIYVIL
jgi:hypothetical protein